ncbi:septation protein SpoVG family protein [Thermoanaerobacter sp. RKWS2]|jgi:stage V sporulation protein G|uniref:septation protein SpoVG family protein n=1 Tax=Thermoanaerobacter sp. RKWS2 TaxID=2983842 RepID=UPI001759A8B2|nr:septation protein SpoVG family protein [Thermoanaerobacter sp. RKWS2]UZQ81814.1 SpoVG family protein [Thermoanaerobacter sp. RKWS2]HHY79944.1 stage V sporulation protein G [Thermoanaerobacter sp.]
MKVTKIAFQKYENGRLKGFAKVFLDDSFVIVTRVIQTRSGLVVALPDHVNKEGKRSLVAYPVNRELRQEIIENVIKAYKEAE